MPASLQQADGSSAQHCGRIESIQHAGGFRTLGASGMLDVGVQLLRAQWQVCKGIVLVSLCDEANTWATTHCLDGCIPVTREE